MKTVIMPNRPAWNLLALSAILLVQACTNFPSPHLRELPLLLLPRASLNPVKTIQTGEVSMTSTTIFQPIQQVDPSRAFVVCTVRLSNFQTNRFSTCTLSANQVNIKSGITDLGTSVRYTVVEFAYGAKVQRGEFTQGPGTLSSTVDVEAMDLQRTFLIVGSLTSDVGTLIDEHRTIMGQITSATQLSFVRNQGTVATNVNWQAVQLDDAIVQSGVTSINAGSSGSNISIQAIDPAKSFVFQSVAGDIVSDGEDSEMCAACSISSNQSLRCARSSTLNTLNLSWFVVSMQDYTRVQNGSVDTASTTPPADDSDTTLSISFQPVNQSRSIILHQTRVTGTGDSLLDSASFTSAFTSNSSVQFLRASADNARADIEWSVVEFASN